MSRPQSEHTAQVISSIELTFIAAHNYNTQKKICNSSKATSEDFKLLSIYRDEWANQSEQGQAIVNQRIYDLRNNQ